MVVTEPSELVTSVEPVAEELAASVVLEPVVEPDASVVEEPDVSVVEPLASVVEPEVPVEVEKLVVYE